MTVDGLDNTWVLKTRLRLRISRKRRKRRKRSGVADYPVYKLIIHCFMLMWGKFKYQEIQQNDNNCLIT